MPRSWRRGFTVVLILVALYSVRSNWFTGSEEHSTGLSSGTATRLEEAFQKQQSGLVVEGAGTVERILEDGGGLVLEIRRETDTLLVPFVKAYLKAVDRIGRRIQVDLPEGLIEICTSRF